jgi:integrase
MSSATYKIVFRKDKMNRMQECPIHIRIIKHREVQYISTALKLKSDYWDFKENKVKKNHPNSVRMNLLLQSLLIKYTDEVLIAETQDLPISAKKIKAKIVGSNQVSFFDIANEISQKYLNRNSIGTYDKACSIIKKLKKYTNNHLTFDDFDKRFLAKYEAYLASKLGNCVNTIGKDFKFLRTVFYYAIDQNVINEAQNPFKGHQIKSEATTRVFLMEEEIGLFKAVSGTDLMNRCRDIALFQYYGGGLRISDVLTLKLKHINNGKINITIRKTGTQLSHSLNESAKEILIRNRGDKSQEDYLFAFIPNEISETDAKGIDYHISSSTAIINKYLKKIALKAGIVNTMQTDPPLPAQCDPLRILFQKLNNWA